MGLRYRPWLLAWVFALLLFVRCFFCLVDDLSVGVDRQLCSQRDTVSQWMNDRPNELWCNKGRLCFSCEPTDVAGFVDCKQHDPRQV